MLEMIKKYSRNSILISVFMIIFSLFLMIKPMESFNVMIMIFGTLILIDGIAHVISYFKLPKEFIIFNFEFVVGILQFIFGLFCFIKPDIVASIFQIVIGVWVLMSSVVRFQLSLDLKRSGNNNYMMLLILSLITFVLALLIIADPLSSFVAITTLLGIVMFISEIINIIEYVIILTKIK